MCADALENADLGLKNPLAVQSKYDELCNQGNADACYRMGELYLHCVDGTESLTGSTTKQGE